MFHSVTVIVLGNPLALKLTKKKKIGQRRCKILLNLLIFPTSIKSEICQESSFGMSNALVTNLTKVSEVVPRSDNLT